MWLFFSQLDMNEYVCFRIMGLGESRPPFLSLLVSPSRLTVSPFALSSLFHLHRFVSMMVFGAAFYSMMVSGDNRIAQVFPIASWGSGLLFTAGTILMLLSIKGYYSVTKRSVKLLATYYALMQIVFVCVGIVTLTAWNKLPDIEKEVRTPFESLSRFRPIYA